MVLGYDIIKEKKNQLQVNLEQKINISLIKRNLFFFSFIFTFRKGNKIKK